MPSRPSIPEVYAGVRIGERPGVGASTRISKPFARTPKGITVNFAFNEEQEELRKTTRQFLEAKSDEAAVREQMDTEAGYDAAVWNQMGEQMGLQGLVIPEEYGGSGYGYIELVVILEEMGRSLLCAPFFSSVVLAANTLIHSGDDQAKADLLPGIATGETIATLAFTEENGRWDEAGITATATAIALPTQVVVIPTTTPMIDDRTVSQAWRKGSIAPSNTCRYRGAMLRRLCSPSTRSSSGMAIRPAMSAGPLSPSSN